MCRERYILSDWCINEICKWDRFLMCKIVNLFEIFWLPFHYWYDGLFSPWTAFFSFCGMQNTSFTIKVLKNCYDLITININTSLIKLHILFRNYSTFTDKFVYTRKNRFIINLITLEAEIYWVNIICTGNIVMKYCVNTCLLFINIPQIFINIGKKYTSILLPVFSL